MADRWCDRCGSKMMPRWPRKKNNDGQMLCPMCTTNQARTAAMDEHPDLAWKRQTFGVANTSLGRAGYAQHRTAADRATQDQRLADPSGWRHNNSSFSPVRHVIEGARAFADERGLRDPHAHDFQRVMQTPDRVKEIGRHYDSMPEFDRNAVSHFHAMRDDVNAQHDFATKKMGIKFETVDHDPYSSVHELAHDVATNKRLKVLGTHVTGGHPVFSDEENDKFRGVHDLFGHLGTGRDFSRHGEEAAFQAHSLMFGSHARPAMAAETRGQNASLILNGHFGPQKIGVLPDSMHAEHTIDWGPRQAVRVAVRIRQSEMPTLSGKQALLHAIAARRPSIVVIAHDSGDGETLFHCPFCGSGQIVARNDGAVDCDFCKTAFTVQVQPQMPAFPQTINGVPIDVPGMPKGGDEADVPPDEAAAAGYPPDAGGSDPDDPMVTDQDSTGDDGGQDDEPEGGPPPFAKASSRGMLRTASGHTLPRNAFMAHLALEFTDDRETTIRRARDYQRS